MKRLSEFWDKQKDTLLGGDGIWAMMKGWGTVVGLGAGAIGAWMTGKHGLTGFLAFLMGARTVLFMVGTLFAAIAALMSFAGIFLTPLFDTIFESLGKKGWLRVGGALGMLAASLYTFGISGSQKIFKGFADGLGSTAGSAWGSLKSSFHRLWTTLFGEDLDDLHFAGWIDDIRGRLWLLGEMIGGYLKPVLDIVAGAFDRVREGIETWRAWDPEGWLKVFRYDNVTTWTGNILAATAAVAVFTASLRGAWRIASFLVGAIWRMSGIPAVFRLLTGATGIAGSLVAGGAISRLMQVFRVGGLGAVLGRGALIGTGPIGWMLLLGSVIWLVIENLDMLKARWQSMSEWMGNSWLGQILQLERGVLDALRNPAAGDPGSMTRRYWDRTASPGGIASTQGLDMIDGAGRTAGDKITNAGANAANALNAVAAALDAIGKQLATIATGAFGSRTDAAFGDFQRDAF
jgi:hypothetical protein